MNDIGARLREVWDDQRAFNLLFRQQPRNENEMADQARDYVLWTESELHELLRALPWKKHRNVRPLHNPAHLHEEGIDTLKFVISLLQCIGIDTLEDMIEVYWRKTAVVRQRYREEWTQKLEGQCVVVDIDNVLCDYITGMIDWLQETHKPVPVDFADLRFKRPWLCAKALGVTEEEWQAWKHEFRITGVKRRLPMFVDALAFLTRCQMDGYQVVLLTSRPIDRYPNIFTDTLIWLNENRLPYDFVWWATDKGERIAQVEHLKDKIRFAVDDDKKYVDQFAEVGIRTYWLQRDAPFIGSAPVLPDYHIPECVTVVHTLMDVDRY